MPEHSPEPRTESEAGAIRYVAGSALDPVVPNTERAIVVNVINDVGYWPDGFPMTITKKWLDPEAQYRAWYSRRHLNNFALGAVQYVLVDTDLWVANAIGHRGRKGTGDVPPIRYPAVEGALWQIGDEALELDASVHIQREGIVAAGGAWDKLEPIVVTSLCSRNVPVYVYDLPTSESA